MGELQETLKQIKEYTVKLTEELNGKKGKNGEPNVPSLEEQKKEIVEQLSSGKISNNKGAKELRRIETRKTEIEALLKKVQQLSSMETTRLAFGILVSGVDKDGKPLSKDKKDKLIKKIAEEIKKINKENNAELAALLGVDEKDLDLNKSKKELEAEIKDLEAGIKVLEKKGHDAESEKEEKTEKEELLNKIKAALSSAIDEKTLQADLSKLSNSKTKKAVKKAILDKYEAVLTEPELKLAEELLAELEKDAKKKEKKDAAKTKFAEITEEAKTWLQKNTKTVGTTLGLLILTIVILVNAKSCSNNKTDKPEETKDPRPSSSQTTPGENEYKKQLDGLMNIGYNEYFSKLMIANFSEETINKLLNSPYIVMVENYAITKGFNLDYINDYENARTIYNITPDKTVDYVNRAYKIQTTGFYNGASINDIVEIVMAIDNKNLQTTDNTNLAQSFNTSFNRIVDNALFGATTQEDINKLDALNYMATEGSEIEQFLSGFKPLCKRILENPDDLTAKQEMYNYLNIFATSLNGFTNEEGALNNKNEINAKAQVMDYYDWYTIYNSFVAPMYPTFVPTPTGDLNSEIDKLVVSYEELQYLMITALESPEINNLRGESLELK